jgi:hypothetical protein
MCRFEAALPDLPLAMPHVAPVLLQEAISLSVFVPFAAMCFVFRDL